MGPWNEEPDEWHGEMCCAIRNPELGSWCGYIAIPPNHPWHGIDSLNLGDIECHGGVTYSENHKPNTVPDGLWWIGFDCAHTYDLVPRMLDRYPTTQRGNIYRDLEYVKQEIQGMLKQAIEARRNSCV